MTNIYHATPYDISATGFYFSTYEDYLEKFASHRNEYGDPVEEYEIQFIDGDNYEVFSAIGVNQANLKLWFEAFEALDEDDAVKVIYLADHLGCTTDEVLGHLDDVYLFKGAALEYAERYIEDTGLLSEIPEHLRYYFDTEAFARDMVLGGDITEVEIMGQKWVACPH
ncbi:antirestriction protein ArdA [Woodsholea maritima]|uniref:antirestriction protein ArdA n=1 Tax=Woodsholea maritima TaxID=240237 RepID=UPI00037B12BC|nr:antirestriction protein ArdA [Woodsholea maritima]